MRLQKILLTTIATICMTVATIAQVPDYVPTSGLIGWWPFNGNANDESGNTYNGIVNGATLTSDRFLNSNKAYSFDGINDVISISNSSIFNFSNGQAISFWVNISSYPVNGESIIFSQQTSSSTTAIGFSISISANGKLNYRIGNGSSLTFAASLNNNVNLGQWYHVVCQYQGGQISVYLNSQISNSSNQPNALVGSPNLSMIIGDDTWGASNAYNYSGKVDDIGIWNRSLNQQEISNLFNGCQLSITTQPNNQNVLPGSNAQFIISTSNPNSTYLWQSNPLNFGWSNIPNNQSYSGSSTSSLSVNDVNLSNHNQEFRVIATSGNCIDTSNVALINILDTCITNVTVYDTLLTTVTDTLVINAQITGINPPIIQNTLKVFPNPATTHITIDYGNFNAMSGYTITIVNSSGQTVFTTSINQQTSYIDLSTWTGNGIYFVQLIDPQNNTIDIKKIVLQ